MKNNTVYVRYKEEDFLSGRKSLLSSTIDTINILKSYKRFQELKAKEDVLKLKLRREIKKAYETLKSFEATIPEAEKELKERKEVVTREEKAVERKEKKQKATRIRAKSKLDLELEEIKAKLASLE